MGEAGDEQDGTNGSTSADLLSKSNKTQQTASGQQGMAYSVPQPHETHGADLAALLGATIAALLTQTGTPGAWGPLSTITGVLLLVILLVFFSQRRLTAEEFVNPDDRSKRRVSFFLGLALSAVIGLVGVIASAQVIQSIWFGDTSSHFDCRSAAVAQATVAVRDLTGINATAITDSPISLPSLVDTTLNKGLQDINNNGNPALQYAFYQEYEATIGNCLAGDTFQDALLWAGVPFFFMTLLWWNWNWPGRPGCRAGCSGRRTGAPAGDVSPGRR